MTESQVKPNILQSISILSRLEFANLRLAYVLKTIVIVYVELPHNLAGPGTGVTPRLSLEPIQENIGGKLSSSSSNQLNSILQQELMSVLQKRRRWL